jgi:hypothetical protein
MAKDFWFNRIVEYWIMPQGDELVKTGARDRRLPQVSCQ